MTGAPGQPLQGIAPLPSTQSEHDFHKFGVHPNSVAPGFHFHLAASINPDTGVCVCVCVRACVCVCRVRAEAD